MLPIATGDRDAQLVRDLAQGDRERAMTELYDRYARRIHGLGLRLLADRALAEELVQNPPNDGVLRTVGSLGVNTRKAVGFDVYSRLSGGRAVTNTAYAALQIRGITRLYTVDVASGDADNAGRIGLFGLSRVDDLAVQPQRV